MLELWIVLGAGVWAALLTLVMALCTVSARADRNLFRNL